MWDRRICGSAPFCPTRDTPATLPLLYSLSHTYHRDNIAGIAGTIDPALRAYIEETERVSTICADFRTFGCGNADGPAAGSATGP